MDEPLIFVIPQLQIAKVKMITKPRAVFGGTENRNLYLYLSLTSGTKMSGFPIKS